MSKLDDLIFGVRDWYDSLLTLLPRRNSVQVTGDATISDDGTRTVIAVGVNSGIQNLSATSSAGAAATMTTTSFANGIRTLLVGVVYRNDDSSDVASATYELLTRVSGGTLTVLADTLVAERPEGCMTGVGGPQLASTAFGFNTDKLTVTGDPVGSDDWTLAARVSKGTEVLP